MKALKITVVLAGLLFSVVALPAHNSKLPPRTGATRAIQPDAGLEQHLTSISDRVKDNGEDISRSIENLGPRLDRLVAAAEVDANQPPIVRFFSSKIFASIVSMLSVIVGVVIGVFAGPRIANRMEAKRSSRKAAIDFWNGTVERQSSVDEAYRFLDAPERLTTPQAVTIRTAHDWFDGIATLASDPNLVDLAILKKLGVAVPMRDFMDKLRTAHSRASSLASDVNRPQVERDAAAQGRDFVANLLGNSDAIDQFLRTP
jgi:hypothetical protein